MNLRSLIGKGEAEIRAGVDESWNELDPLRARVDFVLIRPGRSPVLLSLIGSPLNRKGFGSMMSRINGKPITRGQRSILEEKLLARGMSRLTGSYFIEDDISLLSVIGFPPDLEFWKRMIIRSPGRLMSQEQYELFFLPGPEEYRQDESFLPGDSVSLRKSHG